MQDIKYDIAMNLHSIPATYGEKASYAISIISHIIMVAFFILLINFLNCSAIFITIVSIAEISIITQYILIAVNRKNIKYAFNLNQVFSTLIFTASVFEKIYEVTV